MSNMRIEMNTFDFIDMKQPKVVNANIFIDKDLNYRNSDNEHIRTYDIRKYKYDTHNLQHNYRTSINNILLSKDKDGNIITDNIISSEQNASVTVDKHGNICKEIIEHDAIDHITNYDYKYDKKGRIKYQKIDSQNINTKRTTSDRIYYKYLDQIKELKSIGYEFDKNDRYVSKRVFTFDDSSFNKVNCEYTINIMYNNIHNILTANIYNEYTRLTISFEFNSKDDIIKIIDILEDLSYYIINQYNRDLIVYFKDTSNIFLWSKCRAISIQCNNDKYLMDGYRNSNSFIYGVNKTDDKMMSVYIIDINEKSTKYYENQELYQKSQLCDSSIELSSYILEDDSYTIGSCFEEYFKDKDIFPANNYGQKYYPLSYIMRNINIDTFKKLCLNLQNDIDNSYTDHKLCINYTDKAIKYYDYWGIGKYNIIIYFNKIYYNTDSDINEKSINIYVEDYSTGNDIFILYLLEDGSYDYELNNNIIVNDNLSYQFDIYKNEIASNNQPIHEKCKDNVYTTELCLSRKYYCLSVNTNDSKEVLNSISDFDDNKYKLMYENKYNSLIDLYGDDIKGNIRLYLGIIDYLLDLNNIYHTKFTEINNNIDLHLKSEQDNENDPV